MIAKALAILLAVVAGGAWLTYITSDRGPLSSIRESIHRADETPERGGGPGERRRGGRELRGRPERGPSTAPGLTDQRRPLQRKVIAAVRVPVAAVALLCAALLGSRIRARRRRRYVRYWVRPYRADEAMPEQVRSLIESWHQMTLRRWWQRLLTGQPSLALELHAIPDHAGTKLRLMVAALEEPGFAQALDGRLLACYPDSRLVAQRFSEPPPWLSDVIRLKKRRAFTIRLATPERYEQSLVDSLCGTMSSSRQPSSVQYALTPTFAWFDRFARWLFRSGERELERARVGAEGADPGIRSEVAQQELEGGLELQHRPLFFADVRISAPSHATARHIAGAIRGESSAENRLVERHIRLRRKLYLRRIANAQANPLPSWSRGVLSSSELTGLWHLPSPFLKGVTTERSSVPRVPAPPEVPRPAEEAALMRDERGAVGIGDSD